jgi:ribosomal protein S21
MSKKIKQHQSIIPGHNAGAKVVNNDINFALRTWKRKIKSSNILNILKDKKEFIKPSVIKRKQLNRAKYINKLQELDRY